MPFWPTVIASTTSSSLHFERAALDHDDRVLRAGDDELHVAVRELLERGVEHPLVLNAADAHGGDRRRERNLRGVQRERRGDERENVGVVLLVGGDDVDEDLDFVLEAFREERPDRAVDDAADRISLSLGRPSRLMKPPGILPAA